MRLHLYIGVRLDAAGWVIINDQLCSVLQIKYIGMSGLPLDAFTYILDR
jgi:hypothetical protein